MAKITSHGKTAIQTLVHTLNYTVENFTHQCRFPHHEHFFVQGGFEFNGMEGFIRFYPRGYSNDDENWLTLYIGLESQSDVEIYMNFEVNIIKLVENHEVRRALQPVPTVIHPGLYVECSESCTNQGDFEEDVIA
ncbi:unnamed protein product [Hermetia illucens]|uniref:Uncharacterized protein n=1 Tax=Hermetia illucens TaxID=343691 RepID=A0A7R8UPN0_HERIL|nr:unnamed protein product [Hermetia illucens]